MSDVPDIHLLEARLACLEELIAVQETVVSEQSVMLRAERDLLRAAEAEARRSAAKAQTLIDVAYDAIICLDERACIREWNRSAVSLLGASLVHGESFTELAVESRDRQRFQIWLAKRFADPSAANAVAAPLEAILVTAAGHTLLAECSAALSSHDDVHLVMFVRDVTMSRRLEMELRQAQKLESVGRLAAGVAHEINTPVQFVSDSVHFMRSAIEDLAKLIGEYDALHRSVLEGGPSFELAEQLTVVKDEIDLPYLLEHIPAALGRSLDGLNRVASIVRSLKEFAHPDVKEMTPVDLNQMILTTLTIARSEYKYVAEVDTDLGELPPVTCHAGDVNQAILNIVINAAHAIADVAKRTEQKGRIMIRTRREGESALVSIRDTGGGIPEEIRNRIFDPFFTTKEVGKGTGQGLAIARSKVVENHGGDLTFETAVGRGTTFFLRLPIEGKPGHSAGVPA